MSLMSEHTIPESAVAMLAVRTIISSCSGPSGSKYLWLSWSPSEGVVFEVMCRYKSICITREIEKAINRYNTAFQDMDDPVVKALTGSGSEEEFTKTINKMLDEGQ